MGFGTKMEMKEQEKCSYFEYVNYGTTWTLNDFFDANGYLIIKNLCDPKKLIHPVPEERGILDWRHTDDINDFKHTHEVELQVQGAVARYGHPQYRKIHIDIKNILEQAIGRRLYETYFYDRFYFPGQELERHTDRDACEISVTIHVGTNLKEDWPFWIKTPDVFTDSTKNKFVRKGVNKSFIIEPGDGVVYKGCERPHWRDPMPGVIESRLDDSLKLYYHQIFFHYVLQDGLRAHFAWDK